VARRAGFNAVGGAVKVVAASSDWDPPADGDGLPLEVTVTVRRRIADTDGEVIDDGVAFARIVLESYEGRKQFMGLLARYGIEVLQVAENQFLRSGPGSRELRKRKSQ